MARAPPAGWICRCHGQWKTTQGNRWNVPFIPCMIPLVSGVILTISYSMDWWENLGETMEFPMFFPMKYGILPYIFLTAHAALKELWGQRSIALISRGMCHIRLHPGCWHNWNSSNFGFIWWILMVSKYVHHIFHDVHWMFIRLILSKGSSPTEGHSYLLLFWLMLTPPKYVLVEEPGTKIAIRYHHFFHVEIALLGVEFAAPKYIRTMPPLTSHHYWLYSHDCWLYLISPLLIIIVGFVKWI